MLAAAGDGGVGGGEGEGFADQCETTMWLGVAASAQRGVQLGPTLK